MTTSKCLLFTLVIATLLFSSMGFEQRTNSRRTFLSKSVATALVATGATTIKPNPSNASPEAPALNFATSKSGIQWADAKVGTGQTPQLGTTASIDYVLSTTGARYGTYIYKTADKGAPYRWTMGDGTTIAGLEETILGGEGMTPMLAGGIRRVIIPSQLAYQALANMSEQCGGKGTNGPVPPASNGAFEEFQRFKNIYCNPNRPYQPDVVLDVKLYGKR
eukprot:CAMPEP_0197236912 /NCGR_PEP_ID=MMETSP1429-20130617/3892_1 /TAXON_ID=49237 /ORGANISM="Chaetoceros  sp., Strain UNC1202" /LENGTH=219 /DNA_ID=CAMNT_0042695805 /DNA_START=26 /DNA_END=685 /DNA_ORIENTATION=+